MDMTVSYVHIVDADVLEMVRVPTENHTIYGEIWAEETYRCY